MEDLNVNIEDYSNRDDYLFAQLELINNMTTNATLELKGEGLTKEQKAKIEVRKSLLASLVKLLSNEENPENKLKDLNFGMATELAKQGFKIARKGWNGKGMFAYYVPANSYPASRNLSGSMEGIYEGDLVPYRHYLALKTAQNDIATWSPSTSDSLAEDWMVVE